MAKLLRDTLAGEPITFLYLNKVTDKAHIRLDKFFAKNTILGIDTESTGLNCYRQGWKLRMVQIGNANMAIVIPARCRELIERLIDYPGKWVAHNGPHDFRCIDRYLGYGAGMEARRETHIISHHMDSRNQQEGGIGHGLKELAKAYVGPDADKWEKALKAKLKEIRIPTGEIYKTGKRKGEPKTRICTYSEGWALVDPTIPQYIKYAGADPILTYRLWELFQGNVDLELFVHDWRIQQACDRLHRRGMPIDVEYTKRLDHDFRIEADREKARATSFGCDNINSGDQVAATLEHLGTHLAMKTPTGKYQVTDGVLRGIMASSDNHSVIAFIHALLTARQLQKRQAAYTRNFLMERDANDRIHPSINILGARTSRMSISNPALQQLPTKDRSDDLATEE
jgi:DNA polymerase-1